MAEYENIIDLDKLSRFHNNLKDKGLPLNDWQANKEYKIDCTVIQDGKLYRCKTEHTSTTTFDDTKWSVVSSSGIPYYTSNISYKVDDQVVYDDKIYKCVTAHTSTSTFDDTKWEEISGGGISIWQANTAYNVNDVVIDDNLIWQCATAHTSTSTFDKSKWICLSVVPTGVQAARVTLWEGEYNTVNNSVTVLPNTLQISDSIENYDCLEFTINGFKTTNENNYMTSIVDIKDITYNNASFRITASYYDHYSSFLCTFTDSTHFAICYNDKNIWTDGKITKIVGIKYIQPDSYSTEEKLIGTWIDGKPLYQKTYVCTTPSTAGGSNIQDIGQLDFDTIYSIDGSIVSNGYIVTLNFYLGNGNYVCTYINTSTKYIVINCASMYCLLPARITIQYTKTTD